MNCVSRHRAGPEEGSSREASNSAIATGNVVHLWNARTRQPVGHLVGHDDQVRAITFSPNGTLLATGSHDRTVRFWDVSTQQPIGQPLRHQGVVFSLVFSPDGTLLAAVGDKVGLWDTRTRNPIGLELTAPGDRSVAFNPAGTVLAVGGDGGVSLWNLTLPR